MGHSHKNQVILKSVSQFSLSVLSDSLVVSESTILWTVACQAPLSMGFSRQEYWRGLPCPPSGDLPDPGTEPTPLNVSPALAD